MLKRHGARYRPGAPLDVRWLGGGWSSHFEFVDLQGHRIRCDFVSRLPRVSLDEVAALFSPLSGSGAGLWKDSERLPVRAVRAGGSREDVVIALAREVDRLQQEDRARLEKYRKASDAYLQEVQAARIGDLELPEAHDRICEIAERRLPYNPLETGG